MVRLMNIGDIDDVSELLRQVNLVHHLGRPDLFRRNNKYSKEELKELLNDKDYHIFVYDEGGRAVGHAFCITKVQEETPLLEAVRTLYIDDICVSEDYRGKGIATSLYEYVKNYAKDNGYYNITLNVWSFNDSAYNFYEKMGLTPQKITMEEIL